MRTEKRANERNRISRRELLGGAAAVAALGMVPGGMLSRAGGQPAGKPDSKFGGVQIGTITYSFRGKIGRAHV